MITAAVVTLALLAPPSSGDRSPPRDARVALGSAIALGLAGDAALVGLSVYRFRVHVDDTQARAACASATSDAGRLGCGFGALSEASEGLREGTTLGLLGGAAAVGHLGSIAGAAIAGESYGRAFALRRGRDVSVERRSIRSGVALTVSGVAMATMGLVLPALCPSGNPVAEVDSDFRCWRTATGIGTAAALVGNSATRAGVGLLARGLAIRRAPTLSLGLHRNTLSLGLSGRF